MCLLCLPPPVQEDLRRELLRQFDRRIEEITMETATQQQQLYTDVPADFNGYVQVSRPPLHIPASEVQTGDILIVDGWVSRVTGVNEVLLVSPITRQNTNWSCLHIKGSTNVVRFPHEVVTVVRP